MENEEIDKFVVITFYLNKDGMIPCGLIFYG